MSRVVPVDLHTTFRRFIQPGTPRSQDGIARINEPLHPVVPRRDIVLAEFESDRLFRDRLLTEDHLKDFFALGANVRVLGFAERIVDPRRAGTRIQTDPHPRHHVDFQKFAVVRERSRARR